MSEMHDVIVVGAGPTGLLLAGDLAESGVDVVVLERRRDESNLTRAFAVHARSLEVLDMRGSADDLLPTAAVAVDQGDVELVGVGRRVAHESDPLPIGRPCGVVVGG